MKAEFDVPMEEARAWTKALLTGHEEAMHNPRWMKGPSVELTKELLEIVLAPFGSESKVAVSYLFKSLAGPCDHELMPALTDRFDERVELRAVHEKKDALTAPHSVDEARGAANKAWPLEEVAQVAAFERLALGFGSAFEWLVEIPPMLERITRRAIEPSDRKKILDLDARSRRIEFDQRPLKVFGFAECGA